jgi:hypothetical protein
MNLNFCEWENIGKKSKKKKLGYELEKGPFYILTWISIINVTE